MRSGAGMEVHGVSEKNLLKLVMKKRCAHTDKNLKLLIRIHMPSAGHNLEIVSSSRKDAKSGVSSRELFVNLRAGPEMPQRRPSDDDARASVELERRGSWLDAVSSP